MKTASSPSAAVAIDLEQRLLAITHAAHASTLMCVAETAAACQQTHAGALGLRFLAASPSKATCHELSEKGFEVLHLPIRFLSRFKQAQYAVAMAMQRGKLSPGERLVCSVGSGPAGGGGFILAMDVKEEPTGLSLHELIKLAEGVRASVLEAAIEVACEIARAGRRGKQLGAILMLGDSGKVLEDARQLVPNPFLNLQPGERSLLSSSIRELIVELAKLDGAFVARGDGLIQTAGAFLAAEPAQVRLPQGLGARHLAAAAATARTRATAVVVSATDGHVRVFSHGELVLQMDSECL